MGCGIVPPSVSVYILSRRDILCDSPQRFFASMSSSLIPPTGPGLEITALDNTLGALFIGYSIATILYGIACLQVFLYVTATRAQIDKLWLKLFAFDSAQQLCMSAAMYRFLITDYLNPLALPAGGAGSGEVFTYAQSLLLACSTVLIQLFFCWRIWIFSRVAFSLPYRAAFLALMIVLSLFSFGTSTDLAISGFRHRLLTGNTPDFILAFKLSTTSQVAFDVIMTVAMTFTLQRAQSNIKSTRHVMRIVTLFIVNSNLLSTIFAISSLVTFLTLPNATVYGGISFIGGKTYYNSFLAILNSREFLAEKLSQTTISADHWQVNFAESTRNNTTAHESDTTATGYELNTVDNISKNSANSKQKKSGNFPSFGEV